MTRVACIGEAMIELSMGDTQAHVGVAGDTLNTAVYLHRSAADLSVHYLTCLGNDPFSQRILDFIAQQGVGTDYIRQIEGASPGLYAITTSEEGERSFTYWRSAAAARRLFCDLDFAQLTHFDALYISGISMAILPHDIRLALIGWLNETRITVIYDSNYRPRLWESAEAAQQITQAMWQRADIVLPSIDDEMALFKQTEAEVTQRFVALGKPGALKRGAQGPLSLGSPVSQSYAAAQSPVDTTAAGDSFNAGYLGVRLTGGTQAQALAQGHALAAKVVQYRGAIIRE